MKTANPYRHAAVAAALTAVLISSAAPAQQNRLLNLSANSVVSNESDITFVTCAILEGRMSVAVYAEARAESLNLDPIIQVRRNPFGPDDVIAENDDFGSLSPDLADDIITAVGREPNQTTDSALVFDKNSGGVDSICVIAGDVIEGSVGGFVNVQIQDVTGRLPSSAPVAAAGADYSTAQRSVGPAPKSDTSVLDSAFPK